MSGALLGAVVGAVGYMAFYAYLLSRPYDVRTWQTRWANRLSGRSDWN